MKRYGLVLGWLLVVGTVAWGQIGGYSQIGPEGGLLNAVDLMHGHEEPEVGSPEWFEALCQGHAPVLNGVTSNPTSAGEVLERLVAPPRSEAKFMPCYPASWSVDEPEPGVPESRFLRVSVSPLRPDASDEVFATVSGTHYNRSETFVGHVDLQVEGNEIRLDLYWRRLIYGIRDEAVRQYSYEHTVELGTFSPGTYTLYVKNHGAIGGNAVAWFTVRSDLSWPPSWPSLKPDDRDDPTWPSWWSSFRSGPLPW